MARPASVARRHDLLWIDPAAWQAALAVQHAAETDPVVRGWAGRGHPLVQRRTEGPDARGLHAGLPLPPAWGKRRLGLVLDHTALRERSRPPTLRAAAEGSLRREPPRGWRRLIERLLEVASREQVEPLLFGGLMWQCLTGLAYLSAGSDLDLLWPVDPGRHDVGGLLAALALVQSREARRLDGEIVMPSGEAVQWRELHTARADRSEVVVKTLAGVSLRPACRFVDRAR